MEYPYPPAYRRYTCNIQAPKLKCVDLSVENRMSVNALTLNGMPFNGGATSTLSESHSIDDRTLPELNSTNAFFIGEITIFITDEASKVGIFKCVIYRYASGTEIRIVNLTRITEFSVFTVTANTNTITVTCDLPVRMKWFYVGI